MTDARGREHAPKGGADGGQFVPKGEADGKGAAEKTAEAVRKYSDDPASDLKAMGYGEKKKSSPLTPEEKIASVHIDFSKDNILPELNEDSLKEMGLKKNKPVLLKKSIIERNAQRHPDVKPEDAERLIGETLYSPDDIFPGRSDTGKYFSFVRFMEFSKKGKSLYGVVLLDVNVESENFEIVHWHWTRNKNSAK